MKKRKSTRSRKFLYPCVGVLLVVGLAATHESIELSGDQYGARPVIVSSAAPSVRLQLQNAVAKPQCTQWHVEVWIPVELEADKSLGNSKGIDVSADGFSLPLTVRTPRTTGRFGLSDVKPLSSGVYRLLVLGFGLVGFLSAGPITSRSLTQHRLTAVHRTR